MKFIKVDKKTNQIVTLISSDMDIPEEDGFEFVVVNEFPDNLFYWKYKNGKLIKDGNKPSDNVLIKKIT